ncbi:hypothetical protein MF271_19080 (plasmid) [Deinococcus sp. KNUC1210]|uniref:hypothetical protein n=1 Tax=Deinococcus sp. KNUC1210 TaxID=2917691 RepID=UPI001EF13D13|nr:hypothetical protein [Deinococcus sp. KNUC1210]ULH17425.1 hypothetical protein MF271_19080 [Deinococcus sp. KNUC1210]
MRALLAAATPGPWAWRGEGKASEMPKHPYLRSEVAPRYIVMDFVRQGMQGAQVRFRTKPSAHSILQPVSEIGHTWREHPDAQLIAAAPEALQLLLDALEAAEQRETALTEALEQAKWESQHHLQLSKDHEKAAATYYADWEGMCTERNYARQDQAAAEALVETLTQALERAKAAFFGISQSEDLDFIHGHVEHHLATTFSRAALASVQEQV